MVPIVMETRCMNTSTWPGVVGGKLGAKLYCNLTSDEENQVAQGIDAIVHALGGLGVHPTAQGQATTALLDHKDGDIELAVGVGS